MDFLAQCKKIISIESTPSAGNEEVARFCAELCRQAGLHVELQEVSSHSKSQFNLLARPASKKQGATEFIFQSHLDTVEPGPLGNWTKTDHNPFLATIEGDRIYGLGTTDVKLDFLCKLRALKEFAGKTMKTPFVLVGTFGEEIGMLGAHHLMESGAVSAKRAIIGEPSELQIVYANNGYLVLDFSIGFTEDEKNHYRNEETGSTRTHEKVFHGKAAHSSTPHLGDSAILKLVSYLEKMPQGIAMIDAAGGSSVNTVPADAHVEIDSGRLFENSAGDRFVKLARELRRLEREFLNHEAKEFSPSHPTLNIGLLKTIRDGFDVSVSFRITPNVSNDQIEEWISDLQEFCTTNQMECRRTRLSPPALTPLSSGLVTGALEILDGMGIGKQPITKASGTECSVYRPQGIECIVFGPGVSIGNSHTANEYNLLPQLETASRFYAEAVKRFCS